MAEPFPREKLQPSLLDRLSDDLAAAPGRLAETRRQLDRALAPEQRQALDRLLADERLSERPPPAQALAPFATLDQAARDLLDEILALAAARRREWRRNAALGLPELRAAVLRDLSHLFNTEQAEGLPLVEDGTAVVPTFAGLPRARDSVLNYGIPPLAGRVRTPADYEALARGVEAAIARFEPRLRSVRVHPEGHGEDAAVRSPVTLIIEGELWAYPLPETLRVRTLLDLEEGKARIEGMEAAG
jgi:type VI secretion system protein ImpF